MGQRGPAPTPTALRIIRGNPGKRPINKNEPQPIAGCPEMPPDVAAHAKARACWEYHAPLLEQMRVLTLADGLALANLCLAAAEQSDAQAQIDKFGMLLKTEKTGMVHVNPMLRIRDAAATRVYRYLREFGLTPASKSQVQTVEQNRASADGWDEF